MTVMHRAPAAARPDPPVRLIGIDIDGTLLDSRSRLPERNRRAVRAAVDRGIHVVLVTGRAYHHAMPIARELHGLPAPDTATTDRDRSDGDGSGGGTAPPPRDGAAPPGARRPATAR